MKRKEEKKREEEILNQVDEQPKDLIYGKMSLTFYMTEDEAKEVVENPKGSIARKMKRYIYKLVETAARKFFEEDKDSKEEQNSKEL